MTSVQEVLGGLDKMVRGIYLDLSLFIPFENAWVYSEPIKCNLKFPEQIYLYRRIEEILGIKVRHGTLKENFEAVYNPATRRYAENVLSHNPVYTGQMTIGDILMLNVNDVNFIDADDEYEVKAANRRAPYKVEYTGRLLAVESVNRRGHFSELSEPLPRERDLKTLPNKGHWLGKTYDDRARSAVGCMWLSTECFVGGAKVPLADFFGALAFWTDENPHK